ncbi:TonB-dependent receptor [Ekhidna sp.]|uniref:TonB-dependent receptor n=1 Tax=Ekhidna sp. TaxID=2608089 RepID=UPI00329A5346
MMKKTLLTLMLALSVTVIFAQSTVSGKVIDAETGEALIGATILEKGTSNGVITDMQGSFSIEVPNGATLEISYVGFLSKDVSSSSDLSAIRLESDAVGLAEVQVIASFAIDRKTPVAVSRITQAEIETKIGSQEFPEILKSTPGVYATKAGGGFGDGRINVRGFNSENVAVMINGIPVNDMENGRIFWSNWAGLTDATTSMQVQRGLGASKVAVPSIGGTINIVSKATDRTEGGHVYVATGNDAYSKVGFSLSSGLKDNGWAFTISGAKTQGDGYVDGTEFLGFSYFANIAKKINDSHEVTFTAVGAKQRHGQRQNRSTLEDYELSESGIKYNPDWGYKNGQLLHVEDNFYHKPQLSLNHYWTISNKTDVSTAVYASWGSGGGGGTGGDFDPARNNRVGGPYGTLNIDALVDRNESSVTGESEAWLRASRNDHNWYGILSSVNHQLNENITLLGGLDLRSYVGKHFYEVTDLLGGEFILNDDDINNPVRTLRKGDKYNYNYDGHVGWQGVFAQAEYSKEKLSAFVTVSLSNTSYAQTEYFNTLSDETKANINSDAAVRTQYENLAGGTEELNALLAENQKTDNINFFGYQFKGGANYNLDDYNNVYANIGTFSKAPFYRNVFTDRRSNEANTEAKNETIFSAEIGYGMRRGPLSLNVNVYRTEWNNRAYTIVRTDNDGNTIFGNITGIDALHQGVEVDGKYTVNSKLSFTYMASVGDWRWLNNINDVIIEDENNVQVGDPIDVYIENLRVGDAAQTTAALGVRYNLLDGLFIGADVNFYDNLYASYDPTSRTSPEDNVEAWKVPSYTLMDVNLTYKFMIGDFNASLYGNVYNFFDEKYVADANDGSNNDAQSAFVYYGFGRTWNLGLKVNF